MEKCQGGGRNGGIVEAQKVAPSVRKWTAEEEASLVALETKPISIRETALGCLKEQQKWEMIATSNQCPRRKRRSC